MNLLKLSYDLDETAPIHLNLEKPKIEHNSFISKSGYNSFIIKVENHAGTHVDAPKHFLENGKLILDYSAEELCFKNPLVLDLSKNKDELIELNDIEDLSLDQVDILLFRTGFEIFREDSDKYLAHNPGVSPEAVLWIRKNFPEIRCLGIDTISMSGYQHPRKGKEAHLNAFIESDDLGDPLLLIEDMKLQEIKNMSLSEVIVVPWQIKGIDSAPCTVLAKIN